MTLLMISVINGEEARAASEGEADLIDIKNPWEGALGAPSPGVIQDVCLTLNGKKPFSVALGEFPGKSGAAALAALGCALFEPDYMKVAFLPRSSLEEIENTLKTIKESLSYAPNKKKISLVSVVYADTLNVSGWNLTDFIASSKQSGADGCLIDTWKKDGKSLLDYLTWEKIEKFIGDCHHSQLFCGLAGSLNFFEAIALCRYKIDLIGVRSAVCGGDRLRGTVSTSKVQELKQLVGRSSC